MERKEKRDRECVDECACLQASVGVISATRHANVGKNMLAKVKQANRGGSVDTEEGAWIRRRETG